MAEYIVERFGETGKKEIEHDVREKTALYETGEKDTRKEHFIFKVIFIPHNSCSFYNDYCIMRTRIKGLIVTTFPLENVKKLRQELATHPVYAAVKDMNDLSIFMQHHIYSVWDFMSLVKYLQNEIAPAKPPWLPFGDAAVQRFINDIVLEEESDEGIPLEDGTVTYTSHFNLYVQAMEEVREGSGKRRSEHLSPKLPLILWLSQKRPCHYLRGKSIYGNHLWLHRK